MKRGILLVGTVVLACIGAVRVSAQTTPPTPACPGPGASCTPAKLCGCPNDYSRKPWPVVWCMPRCGVGDDYCPKAEPWLWRLNLCQGCDDYLRKPCPSPCRPLDTSRYHCWPLCPTILVK